MYDDLCRHARPFPNFSEGCPHPTPESINCNSIKWIVIEKTIKKREINNELIYYIISTSCDLLNLWGWDHTLLDLKPLNNLFTRDNITKSPNSSLSYSKSEHLYLTVNHFPLTFFCMYVVYMYVDLRKYTSSRALQQIHIHRNHRLFESLSKLLLLIYSTIFWIWRSIAKSVPFLGKNRIHEVKSMLLWKLLCKIYQKLYSLFIYFLRQKH